MNRWFGPHQSRWPVIPLKRVAQLGTGHTPSRAVDAFWEDCTIPWVTVADIQALPGFGLSPLLETEQHISEAGLENSAAVLHPADTVMLSRTASIGHSCRIGRPMATTQAFVTWTPGPDVDSRFLLLALRALRPELDRLAYGSTHRTIYMPDIAALRIPVPPLHHQVAIAEFLDSECRRIDQLTSAVEATRARITDHFRVLVDETFHSIDGEVEWVPVKRFVDPSRPITYGIVQAGEDWPGGIPYIRPVDMAEFSRSLDPSELRTTSPSIAASYKRSALAARDVVVSIGPSYGKLLIVPPELEGANLTQGTARVAAADGVEPEYLQWALRTSRAKAWWEQSVGGATFGGLNLGPLAETPIPKMNLEDQRRVVAFLDEKWSLSEALLRRLGSLTALIAEYRTALIAEAVTGQLDVTDVSEGQMDELLPAAAEGRLDEVA